MHEAGAGTARRSGDEVRAVIIGAGARGNRVFAELMRTHDIGWRLTGVVEPHEGRRESFRREHRLPADRTFQSVEALLQAPSVADVAFICTPDVTHYTICRDVSAAGYDVVLEKPVATSLPDCLALLDVEETHGNRIFVAHVLRYAPFFRAVKDIVASRRHGLVRNIRLTENVGHWHFAHSYVRGSWRRRDESAPIILTKSSHDMDIIAWLMAEDRPAFVSSFGSLEYFTAKNAPAEAADRCVDCPLQDRCLYSATRFYVHPEPGWPYDVPAPGAPPHEVVEARRQAIATGPYGRCVWKSDNDVCDNQTVSIQFESGIHASFGLYALTADNTRRISILMDEAELRGDLSQGHLAVHHFTGRRDRIRKEEVPLPRVEDHHGGGDLALLTTLHDHLVHGHHKEVVTSLRSSLVSHALAFMADDSRRQGGAPLPVPAIFDGRGHG